MASRRSLSRNLVIIPVDLRNRTVGHVEVAAIRVRAIVQNTFPPFACSTVVHIETIIVAAVPILSRIGAGLDG